MFQNGRGDLYKFSYRYIFWRKRKKKDFKGPMRLYTEKRSIRLYDKTMTNPVFSFPEDKYVYSWALYFTLNSYFALSMVFLFISRHLYYNNYNFH